MLWKTTALIAALLLASGATAKPAAPKAPPPAKAAPARPASAAKPAPKPVVSPVADFDARNPQSVMAVLNAGGGKATLVHKDAEAVLLSFASVAANFTVLFANCDAQGRACKAVAFDYADDKAG